VVVAHADVEVFGCGGTIVRHLAEGDVLSVIFTDDGVGLRERRSIRASFSV